MKKIVKVACAQVGSEKTEKKTLEKLLSTIEENSDSDLIVFPEFYFKSVSEEMLDRIMTLIDQTRVAVVFGAVEKEGQSSYDSAYLLEYDKIHRYRKTHVHWTEDFKAGDRLDVFGTSLGKLGMLVCYDSTFIETSRVLALEGAEIIVIVAAVPAYFDVKISLIRIQANAAENQVFIIYVNKPIKELCSGNSMIVSPKGRVISSAGSVETTITGVLNYDDLKEWRQQEHIFPFRRPELYGSLSARDAATSAAKKINKKKK
jgi:predicted amidohydrolase